MPTIIDSLVMTLGLDSQDYDAGRAKVDKGLKDTGASAEDTGKKLKKSLGDGATGFETMAKNAAKFLALLGSTFAVKEFIQHTIESNSQLERFSKNIGESVDAISAWMNATELAGGSAGGFEGAMSLLSQAQTDLRMTGESSLIPYFSRLGVDIGAFGEKTRPVLDVLRDLADKFHAMDRPTAMNIGRRMGFDTGTMNLLVQGSKAIDEMVAKQKSGNAVTAEQAAESSKLRERLVEMEQSFSALGRTILHDVYPYMVDFFNICDKIGTWIRQNTTFVEVFFGVLAAGIAAVAVAALPFNGTAALILGVAAAIATLYTEYDHWKKGEKGLIDREKWAPAIKFIKDMIDDMNKAISSFIELVDKALARLQIFIDKAAGAEGSKIAKAIKENSVLNWLDNFGGDVLEFFGFKRLAPKTVAPKTVAPKTVTPPAKGPTSEREKSALDYFQSQGWTKEQSAGLVANLYAESGLNEKIPGGGGKAYGIGQWHPDRQADFQNLFGHPIQQSTFEEQLAFVQYELTQGKEKAAGDALRKESSAAGAGAVVSKKYERPAAAESEAYNRGRMADSIIAGVPGASRAASGAGAVESARAKSFAMPQQIADNSDRSSETNIGTITIHTQATDAEGIARDIKKATDYLFTSQANYGLA